MLSMPMFDVRNAKVLSFRCDSDAEVPPICSEDIPLSEMIDEMIMMTKAIAKTSHDKSNNEESNGSENDADVESDFSDEIGNLGSDYSCDEGETIVWIGDASEFSGNVMDKSETTDDEVDAAETDTSDEEIVSP